MDNLIKKTSIAALLAGFLLTFAPISMNAKQWTLKECIDYALQNNISLQKTPVAKTKRYGGSLIGKSPTLAIIKRFYITKWYISALA